MVSNADKVEIRRYKYRHMALQIRPELGEHSADEEREANGGSGGERGGREALEELPELGTYS